MDERRLISVDNFGFYRLNFPNKCALTIEEIEEIFSSYGKVQVVKCAGDERGFRFVCYAKEEEAIKATIGLKGHPKIHLVPKREKKQNSNGDQNKRGNMNNGNYNGKFDKQKNYYSSNSHVPSVNNNNGKEEKSKPKNSNKKQEMPALVPVNKATNNKITRQIIPAVEVIIANIDDSYGSAFILHLLEKFEPISITKMNFVKSLNFRYCQVYFKNASSAMAAVEHLDNYPLMGKKLIAVRSELKL